jgi:crotonobetaine/carnitine-CoA ligase
VKGFFVPWPGFHLDPIRQVEFLVPRMPHFMVPRFIGLTDALPKTPTQKVQKHILREKGNSDLSFAP